MMEWVSTGPTQTQAWGQRLGRCLRPGHVLALQGTLGAGKTTLTQGIARGMGISTRVASPTFVLVSEYETTDGGLLRHVDCYRLPEEKVGVQVAHLGLLDWLQAADSVLIIEWAERIAALLPHTRLEVRLASVAAHPDQRRLSFWAQGCHDPAWLEATLRSLATG